MKAKLLLTLFAFMMFGIINAKIIDNGTCGKDGDNITWELNDEGVLTLKGSGEMKDYYDQNVTPWYSSYHTRIKYVTISNGITNVGRNAFDGCSSFTSITIPNSVLSIGEDAFYGCRGLTSITIPNSVTSIGEAAFEYCI